MLFKGTSCPRLINKIVLSDPPTCILTWSNLRVDSNLLLSMLKQLDELQVIIGFVQAAKRLKTSMKSEA